MEVSCPNCGATNRNTSRFCARCGELLHVEQEGQSPDAPGSAGGQGEKGDSGQSGLDLPWLQTMQDRALRPKTERLTDAQPIQTTPTPPAQPGSPQQQQPAETPGAAGTAMQAHGSTPQTQPPANEAVTAEELQDGHDRQPLQNPPDPNEAPPEWVVSILEPASTPSPGGEQAYEQEELEHIMPWVHGPGQQSTQEGDQVAQANASGLPPWLADVTVQETLRSAGSDPSLALPSDLDLDGIEPFVPPVLPDEEGTSVPVAPVAQAPEWLRSLNRRGEPEPEPVPRQSERITSLSLDPTALTSPVDAPIVRDIPVQPPRAGSVEALAALISASEVATEPKPVVHGDARDSAAVAAATGRGAKAWLLPDGVIYLAILGVLLAMLIARPSLGEAPAPSAPDVQPFYNAIEAVSKRALPQERVVLVAYDWDATRSAEMSLLSESVMRHLMARHIGFITVSTNPQGPGFAQQVTSRLSEEYREEYGYVYGREYLVMGYLPGSQAALGALATNFRLNLPVDYQQNLRLDNYPGFTGGSRLQNVSDFALVIALTSDEAEMRNWVEQVGARTGVPIVAAVPQALDPLARPYRNIPRAGLQAVISGPAGALQYTRQLQAQGLHTGRTSANATPLADRLNAQSAAQLLVAAVIIAALIGAATRRIVRRR